MSKYETTASIPSSGEVYMKLLEDLTHAQEGSAMLGHLAKSQGQGPRDRALGDGWLAISELIKRMVHQVTKLATKKLN